jgi:hypothetical protein
VWGCEFDGLEVRVMDHLPSKILVGVQFWMKYGLQLDLSKQCARIIVDGVDYAGPVLPIRRRSYVNEEIREVEETESVTKEINSMNLTELSDDENDQRELRKLLLEFQDVFHGTGLVVGCEHRILLKPDSVPAFCPIRRRSPAQEDAEKEEVSKHLSSGIMEPSVSPWAAANVFVPKKNGGLRTTTDFRLLNDMKVSDTYPMEDVRGTLDWLGGKQIFSTLDLKDGFFQVMLAEESRPLTAVRTVMGLMQYRRLPQGLKKSCYGARAMNMIGCAGPPTPSKIRMNHTLVAAPAFLATSSYQYNRP